MTHGIIKAELCTAEGSLTRAVYIGTLRRFAAYLVFWLILIGLSLDNLIVGIIAAACATWVSVVLLPVSGRSLSLTALAQLAVRLPWQSLIAGADVARRALDPRLPLRPGFVTYTPRLGEGPDRNAFRALMSLQPGALPVSDEAIGDILVHCLDTSQPIKDQMAAEEVLFSQLTSSGVRKPVAHG